MRLEAHPGAAAFLAAAAPVLAADEPRHNLMYGICSSVLDAPEAFCDARFWTVHADDGPAAAALMTPPFNIVVARPLHADALPFAARTLSEEGVHLPGVTGAIPEVQEFAAAWEQVAGASLRIRMKQGIYAARAVVVPEGIPGVARQARLEDRKLVLEWLHAFEKEAMQGDSPRADHEQWLDRRLASATAGVTLWEDTSRAVSMCSYGGPTPHGIRIGPVYTPPESRRRGYASAVTADVTKRLLDTGRDYCFLYTDLANPTSNRIYMDIGYERVCDSAEYAFEAA
jgi:ribosomal protein S18 acetylase RimI-like enzyme